jgi:hypothetical protein
MFQVIDPAFIRGWFEWFELSLSVSLMLRPTVNRPACLGIKHPSGSCDQIFITCVTVTVFFFCGSLSEERTVLPFVCAAGNCQPIFLGSKSLGTWDHILLSQIWDFLFRRLLRLAGSRWKYLTPPPNGWSIELKVKGMLRSTAAGQSGFEQSTHLGLTTRTWNCLTVACLLISLAHSNERTVLPFAIATGPRQRSNFWSETRRTRGHILLSRLKFEC